MKYSDIKIDTSRMAELEALIKSKEDYNPACKLAKYWSERMSPVMMKKAVESGKLQYGFVGDGWPVEQDQSQALNYDKLNIAQYYQDDIKYRDVGDAIYQTNVLLPYLMNKKNPYDRNLYVMDIGSGYGRLAYPFVRHMWEGLTYFGVDYSPIGLLTAGQFVKQMFPDVEVLDWSNYEGRAYIDYDFISLPAWALETVYSVNKAVMLDICPIDLFISIHSFQEMLPETVDYYIQFMMKYKKRAYFYSINIMPKRHYIPNSWECIFDKPYPVNRDGSYNEKLWLIK